MIYLLVGKDLSGSSIESIMKRKKLKYEVIYLNKSFYKRKQQIIEKCNKEDKIIYFCDDFDFESEASIFMFLKFLYDYGFSYIGVKPDLLSPSRQLIKKVCINNNIGTPDYRFVYSNRDLDKVIDGMNYPLFVKPENGFYSYFIDNKSKVNNFEELYEKVNYILENYGGALIEEFIDGREMAILVYGDANQNIINVLDPIESVFTSKDKNFFTLEMNRDGTDFFYQKIDDDKIIQMCKHIGRSVFEAFNFRGYIRLDGRINNYKYYVTDVNSYPMIFYKEWGGGACCDNILKINNITEDSFLDEMFKFAIKNDEPIEDLCSSVGQG